MEQRMEAGLYDLSLMSVWVVLLRFHQVVRGYSDWELFCGLVLKGRKLLLPERAEEPEQAVSQLAQV
jgi:hypothetical protein